MKFMTALNHTLRRHSAVLAYTRGQVAASSCRSCVGGAGPCVECVVVPGSLKESYTNFHYASEGARCSFRKYTSLYWYGSY